MDIQGVGLDLACERLVDVELAACACVNYAMQQNDVPVIRELRLTNRGQEPLRDILVRITTDPACSTPWEQALAELGAGQVYNLGTVDLQLSHEFLAQLTERVAGSVGVVVQRAGETLAQVHQRLDVLAYDEWAATRGLPEMLAAFVTPNHPLIEPILANAAQLLAEWTGTGALVGYQTGDPQRVFQTVAAVYGALQRRGLNYVAPPASFEDHGQKIRLPDRILENGLGTCLDLAVLCAAVLEQADLNPLVVFVEGHAFVGAWLVDECFADCTIDDPLRLLKRVELDEIVVLEATALTAAGTPFEVAVDQGRRRLAATEQFRYVVDIRRARKARIRPLPLRGVAVPTAGSPSPATPARPQAPVSLPSGVAADEPARPPETPATRLDGWKRRLLDLSLRNRLLNFRETRKTFELLCPELSALEDALADGQSFQVHPRPAELQAGSQRQGEVYQQRTGSDLSEELLREEFGAHRLRANLPDGELARRLLEIYRDSRTSIEESGANTAYLALGFLSWREAKTASVERLAPILLIPLEIERRSLQEGFRLRQGDDEPTINHTLLELLTKDYELQVPGVDPLPLDDHGLDVSAVMRAFRRAIRDIDGWQVLERAYVGLFSFTKFLMWRDLEVRGADLQKSKVVDHLINRPTEPFPDEGEWPAPERLDEELRPDQTFCLLSSDSSQLAAIHAAAQGRSFVLHGPPGTGKSQTIANLIAHALATGKSVLFVSEKAAALQVVHRRLKQCGLGPFCLELHSNKSNKLAVINQLGESLDFVAPHSPDQWQAEAERVAALRHELNGYVAALHRPRAAGETVFTALSRLIALREAPVVTIGWSTMGAVDAARLAGLRETAGRLQQAAVDYPERSRSVWVGIADREWTQGWRNELETALTELQRLATDVSLLATEVAPQLGLPADGWSQTALSRLAASGAGLLAEPRLPAALLTEPDWPPLAAELTQWLDQGRRRNAALARLLTRFEPSCLACARLTNRVDSGGPVLLQRALDRGCDRLPLTLERLRTAAAAFAARAAEVGPWLGQAGADPSLAELGVLYHLATALAGAPAVPAALISAADWQSTASQIEQWVAFGRRRDALREALLARYDERVLDLDAEGLKQQLAAANQTWALPRRLGRRAVRATLMRLARPGHRLSDAVLADDLKDLLTLRTYQEQLCKAESLATPLLGAAWREGNAEWETLDQWRTWTTALRAAIAKVAGPDFGRAAALREQLSRLVAEGGEQLHAEGVIGSQLAAYQAAAQEFNAARQELEAHLEVTPRALWGSETTAGFLDLVAAQAAAWAEDLGELRQLAEAQRPGTQLTAESLPHDLADVATVLGAQAVLEQAEDRAASLFGEFWRGGESDWDELARLRSQAEALRACAEAESSEQAPTLRQRWATLLSGPLAIGGELSGRLAELVKQCERLAVARETVATLLGMAPVAAWGEPDAAGYLERALSRAGGWLAALPELRQWCHWRLTRRAAVEAGLEPLAAAVEAAALPADRAIDAFERSFAQWFVQVTTDAEPALRQFVRQDFEARIKLFQEADERYLKLTRDEVLARLAARVPRAGDRTSENSDMGILLRQRQRQRGHKAVRALFQEIPSLLPRLKPCLLMSPLSVAQYLDPASPPFNLVIFDEASQIPVWDAIGAMARGQEVVVVGDPKQLPPTSFFDRGDGDDALDEGLVEDLESVLDDCLAAQLPQRHLSWHYRSRHESLIAFSNQQYYENRLLTFPSPHEQPAVSMRLVKGVYDKGRSRTNRIEAEAVVAEIVRRLQHPTQAAHTIGVVTFNQSQQVLIQDLLEEARRKHPAIEPYFGSEADEPVFVKNLENVQGDERDAVLFSIGYGPDAAGSISMNFGPLNRDGGQRRLNVAITRARREVVVFSCLRADQIDLSRVRGEGVSDLKCFLDYAERGPVALVERRTTDPLAACESPFEEQVCAALRARGHTVHPQVGCSGYRIDLAIVDPDAPGRYLLGIECDGATYHRARTARDRDRLREEVLRDLGWRLHRVWSSDWWDAPERELARIEAALELARQEPDVPPPAPAPVVEPEPQQERVRSALLMTMAPSSEALAYRAYENDRRYGDLAAFHDDLATDRILLVLNEVVATEAPISFELAARRVAACWGIGSVRHLVRARIECLLPRADVFVQPEGARRWLWRAGERPEALRTFRLAGPREPGDICPEELANAARQVVEQQLRLPRQDLLRETAYLIGYKKLTQQMEPLFDRGVALLLARGMANEQEGQITLVEPTGA